MLWGLFLFVRQAVRDAAGDQTWSVMMYGQWVGDTVKDLQTYASLKQTKACGKKAFGEKLEPKPQPNSLVEIICNQPCPSAQNVVGAALRVLSEKVQG